MTLDVLWLHAAVLLGAFVVGYFLYMRTMRLKASFDLYRVRDKFIYLVASDVLKEEDLVFRHYYSRINNLLASAPNVGVDDVLHTVFNDFKPNQFASVIEHAKKQANKLMAEPVFQNAEVRDAAADYYRSVQSMILSHSSFVRATYILTQRAMVRFPVACIQFFVPSVVDRGMAAIQYAAIEEKAVTRACTA